MIPAPLPHGRTARRLEWSFLPVPVRQLVESRCGSSVVEAISQNSGFTPGFASVLVCADGSRHFVKAASVKAQRAFADSYREEARKLAALPASVAAPRLLWIQEVADWVVLETQYVPGRAPVRPWQPDELTACLDLLEQIAEVLTPAPAGLALDPFAAEAEAWPAYWDFVATARPNLPHLAEAAALAARYAEVVTGSTMVHTDVRDDNLILTGDGRALLCDWNWPVLGPAWLDTVLLLLGPYGDGLDIEAVLAERALTRDVPAEHLDIVLALLVGYFFRQGDQPVPATSPYLREHQAWYGEVAWDWLCQRRGWKAPG